MKKILAAFLLFIALNVFSQDADPGSSDHWKKWYRLTIFDSIHNFLRENYAGYADKVNAKNQKEFDQHTKRHMAMFRENTNNEEQLLIEKSWMRFFQDEHLGISLPYDTSGGKLSREMLAHKGNPLTDEVLADLEKKDASAIEGIYYTVDSSYKVAVIKRKKRFAAYEGVIVSTKNKEWMPGSLKFKLVSAGKGLYDVIWFGRYYQPSISQLDFSKGNVFHKEGWYKSGWRKEKDVPRNAYKPPFEEENKFNCFFKQIDEETGYLRIGSFDTDFIGQIDSVVKVNKAKLESLPYLVIDIRGNGGGADIAYRPLKRLLYTDPVKSIGVDLLATTYNIDITIQLINSIAGIPEAEKKEYNEILERARTSGQRMFDFAHDTTEIAEAIPFPKKIAVVMNGRVASTAEQFLLEAKQSKKVTLFGTHSLGVLDYANVREKNFPIGFEVYYPTTRSRRINIGEGIDNVGIMPDIPVVFAEEGWLQKIVQEIKK